MGAAPSACLDEDEVLAFVAGKLGDQRRGEVLSHVDGCESCRMLAAEVAREHPVSSEPPPMDEPTPSGPEIRVGTRIAGRYRLEEAVGRGAMGVVYRAHDEEIDADVALKLLHRDAGRPTGFARELRIGRKISHPNVCRLHDAGSTEDFDYISMELVDGEALLDVLARGELPRARAVEVLREVAAGLAAAHAQGVVHRDLKPANVMIERSGRAVLTDFGFATDLDAKHSRRLVGTPQYWSPEQARGEPATPASDVYSFGVMAFRMLTGADLSLSDPDALDRVPRELRRVVASCVELRPADRLRDGGEVLRALERAHASTPTRAWPWAALAAVAVAIGAWWAFAHGAARPPVAAPSGSVAAEPIATSTIASASAGPSAAAPVENSSAQAATSLAGVHPPPVISVRRPRPQPSASAAPAPAPTDSGLLYRR